MKPKLIEKLTATRINWLNCIKANCEFLPDCQSTKPDEINCKKFTFRPYTIYRDKFIKIGDAWYYDR